MGLGRARATRLGRYTRPRHAPASGGGNRPQLDQDARFGVLRERIHIRGASAQVGDQDDEVAKGCTPFV